MRWDKLKWIRRGEERGDRREGRGERRQETREGGGDRREETGEGRQGRGEDELDEVQWNEIGLD